MPSSEVVEQVLELVVGHPVERLSDEEGELVRVLAHGRHAHRPRPVVVQVRHLVSQHLELGRLQARLVADDVVSKRELDEIRSKLETTLEENASEKENLESRY